MSTTRINRRAFLKAAAAAAGAAAGAAARGAAFPVIVPATVFGPNPPSRRIQVGAIGVGRISREHDLPNIIKFDSARVVAVCDLDRKRLKQGKDFVEKLYAENPARPAVPAVRIFDDFRELVGRRDIDAVVISTPDHWHALPAVAAARAGKDVYLQKPTSLTIAEGRVLSDTIRRTGRILQIGSQQRSMPQFRLACELVRNGRIGALHTIRIGLPIDPSGEAEPEMPVPSNLNYDMWLGSTPRVYYTEKRVHPQNDYSRPGWLRCEQFGAGMITGWGVHHIDIAHWAMNLEYSGPVEVEARAEFPKSGLWDVHGKYFVTAKYANGVTMLVSDEFPNGVRFEGSEGWIFVARGDYAATTSDPVVQGANRKSLDASDAKILASGIGPQEIHLYDSPDQHGNWLDCVRTRRQPIAPAEVGHRTCSACLVSHIAMKLGRKLKWDPARERFVGDDAANVLLSRPMRAPWVL
jgi:myo-inositol 2-dehydrogenase/D-chiro-inositol 1-dehydrogenase